MDRTLNLLSEEALAQLELEEDNLLNWGFLGGYFDAHQRVEKVLNNPPTQLIGDLWEKLQEQGGSVETIVSNLETRKLIFKAATAKYRTRYAETVRLLYLLKQRFSKEDWMSAPNLVSDIKSNLMYRRYPKRDQDWWSVRDELSREEQTSAFILNVIEQLLDNGALDLAAFQTASLNHLMQVAKDRDRATIIGAGTGSGKTKAFYLPAFGRISESIKHDSRFWTRMIGIYPRTELLKDQFREALSEIQKINGFLKSNFVRPITIGSYYGDVPPSAADVKDSKFYKWDKQDEGYVCPSLSCPDCNPTLLWLTKDLEAEIKSGQGHHERLHCTNEKCGTVLV